MYVIILVPVKWGRVEPVCAWATDEFIHHSYPAEGGRTWEPDGWDVSYD